MREVVIAGQPEPYRLFGRTLKDVPARQLGAICIREALQRAGVDPATVDEVVLGNVLQAGLGRTCGASDGHGCRLCRKKFPAFTPQQKSVDQG